MARLVAWAVLLAAFLMAGEGLNLLRIHLEAWLAYGHSVDALWMALGLVMFLVFTAFLGGFVIYRDTKRGKIRREGWRGRPARQRRSSGTTPRSDRPM